MKLLLDENLSRRLVPFLQSDFPGSSQYGQSAPLLNLLCTQRESIEQVLLMDGMACIELSSEYLRP